MGALLVLILTNGLIRFGVTGPVPRWCSAASWSLAVFVECAG